MLYSPSLVSVWVPRYILRILPGFAIVALITWMTRHWIGRLIDWLIDWFFERLIEGLSDWLIDWCMRVWCDETFLDGLVTVSSPKFGRYSTGRLAWYSGRELTRGRSINAKSGKCQTHENLIIHQTVIVFVVFFLLFYQRNCHGWESLLQLNFFLNWKHLWSNLADPVVFISISREFYHTNSQSRPFAAAAFDIGIH